MKQTQQQAHNQRFFATALLIGVLIAVSITGLIVTAFAYTLLGDREIRMGSSQPGDVTDYTVEFEVSTGGNLGGIAITFCADSPVIGDPECVAPTGFDLTAALDNLDAGDVDLTGYQIAVSNHASSGGSGDNTAVVSSVAPASVSAGETVSLDLLGVTNPSDNGTFFARIYTYEEANHALGYDLENPSEEGDVVDAGGVALSTAETIDITFMVQERITFCVFTNELSAPGDYQTCSGTSAGAVVMGDDNGFLSVDEPSISKDTKYNIATNASAGATIRVRGNTLASGSAMIDPIGSTAAGSVPGTEQFGLCTYLHPNSLSGGLVPSSPYNHADCVNTVAGQGSGNDAGAQFAFDDTGIASPYGQAIATKTAGDWSTGKLVLLANVSNVTQPGIYTTEFYVVATGRY